jgi:hypothetical protein
MTVKPTLNANWYETPSDEVIRKIGEALSAPV